ncbi:hypothetical protein PVA45_08535 (plasmid) [Entomospira entomophila]|uniref:Uncharacterized protein n=1 Tax=Entomospira entomophila TaxID=2719988 RepID=A0A968GFM0_9SPIO|nr:hypothetical protein [Entomospira entomophilus]NIZ41554.1 hypothetical protein [Entomospira entomophilus]WDI36458.1 hypothetical protein PVA45_08535 [Entomospira entomophilus]
MAKKNISKENEIKQKKHSRSSFNQDNHSANIEVIEINWDLVNKDPNSKDVSKVDKKRIYQERKKAVQPFIKELDNLLGGLPVSLDITEYEFILFLKRLYSDWILETEGNLFQFLLLDSGNYKLSYRVFEKKVMDDIAIKIETLVDGTDKPIILNFKKLYNLIDPKIHELVKNFYYKLVESKLYRFRTKNEELEEENQKLQTERQKSNIDKYLKEKEKSLKRQMIGWSVIIGIVFTIMFIGAGFTLYNMIYHKNLIEKSIFLIQYYLPFAPLGWALWFAIVQFSKAVDVARMYQFKHAVGEIFIDFKYEAKNARFQKEFMQQAFTVIFQDPVEAFKKKKYKGTPSEEFAELVKVINSIQSLQIPIKPSRNDDDIE